MRSTKSDSFWIEACAERRRGDSWWGHEPKVRSTKSDSLWIEACAERRRSDSWLGHEPKVRSTKSDIFWIEACAERRRSDSWCFIYSYLYQRVSWLYYDQLHKLSIFYKYLISAKLSASIPSDIYGLFLGQYEK